MSLPMWMPGRCSGTIPILVRGPSRPRAEAIPPPPPRIEVFNTQFGNVTQVVVPPTIYEAVQALKYHHLIDPYVADHRVVGERALKERAQRYPWPEGPACPPQCRPGAPPTGTHTTVAGRSQGLDPDCWRTPRRRSSGAGWPKPRKWRPCTTGGLRSRSLQP